MRSPHPDPFSNFQKEKVREVFRDILTDPEIRVTITYSILTATPTYTIATGLSVRTTTDKTFTCARRVVSVSEAAESGGKLQVGDRQFVIDQADLTAQPTTNDRITEATIVYEVIRWTEDPMDLLYVVTARKV